MEYQSLQPGKTVDENGTYSVFYNATGKNVIRLDLAFDKTIQKPGFLELKFNLHNLRTTMQKNAAPIRRAVKFFNAERELRERKPVVDAIIITDVLNYLDYAPVLKRLSTFLKIGGRIVIRHAPLNGFRGLFHPKRPKTIEGLVRFLKHQGFEIEHFARKEEKFPTAFPRPLLQGEIPHAHIVAVKS